MKAIRSLFAPKALRQLMAPCLLLAASDAAASITMVNWGGNYVDNNQLFNGSYTYSGLMDLDGDLNADDSRFGYAYNALSPTPLSPSSGYSGTSDTFYGGFVINTYNANSNDDTLQPNAQGVHQNGSTDHLKFQTQHSGNHDHTFALLMYWDKSGFLNGGNTNSVIFDANSTFSFATKNSTNVQDATHLHFVLRDGDQFYVSQAYWGGTNLLDTDSQGAFPNGTPAVYNPFATGLNWKLYNPNGLDLQWAHGDYDYSSDFFTNITGFGFYVDTLNLIDGNNNSDLEITSFSVSAIPEPSRFLLCAAGLGLMWFRRRR